MTSRRQFIQAAGITAAVVPLAGLSGLFSPAAAHTHALQLERFVFDDRFAESIEAAGAIARQGISTHRISGDVTDLWYHHLDLLWKREPAAIAGVTTADALFVLEQLGWDHRMRVVYRGRHDAPRQGRVEHQLAGAASFIASMEGLSGTWCTQVASSLAQCRKDVSAPVVVSRSTPSTTGRMRDVALFSWVLAPISALEYAKA